MIYIQNMPDEINWNNNFIETYAFKRQ